VRLRLSSVDNLHRDPDCALREPLRVSLMKDERALLSEEAIQRLVTARIKRPDRIKLAVWRPALGDPRAPLARFEFLQAQGEYLAAIMEPLQNTNRSPRLRTSPRRSSPRIRRSHASARRRLSCRRTCSSSTKVGANASSTREGSSTART